MITATSAHDTHCAYCDKEIYRGEPIIVTDDVTAYCRVGCLQRDRDAAYAGSICSTHFTSMLKGGRS